jgi:hypothetical protein
VPGSPGLGAASSVDEQHDYALAHARDLKPTPIPSHETRLRSARGGSRAILERSTKRSSGSRAFSPRGRYQFRSSPSERENLMQQVRAGDAVVQSRGRERTMSNPSNHHDQTNIMKFASFYSGQLFHRIPSLRAGTPCPSDSSSMATRSFPAEPMGSLQSSTRSACRSHMCSAKPRSWSRSLPDC